MGLLFALLVWAMCLLSIALFRQGSAAMPPPISDAAGQVDAQLFRTIVATGIAFVVVQGLLGFYAWRYRARAGGRARYVRSHRLVEVAGAVVVGTVFVGLALSSQKVWADLHLRRGASGAVVVEVTGEQFAWNIRYAGPDGVFGRTDPALYNPIDNPLGLIAADAASADDVVALGEMVVPVGQPVEVRLGSKDVLHSFFVPALRIKQDTVPGLRIPLRFTPRQAGQYEIVCAELCGLGHYRMKATLRVVSESEFEAWLVAQKTE